MRRTIYLVLFTILVAALALGGYYAVHGGTPRAPATARPAAAAKGAPGCDTPAPPPPPKTPPPNLPGFAVEAGCGPGEAAKAPKK